MLCTHIETLEEALILPICLLLACLSGCLCSSNTPGELLFCVPCLASQLILGMSYIDIYHIC